MDEMTDTEFWSVHEILDKELYRSNLSVHEITEEKSRKVTADIAVNSKDCF